MTFRENIFELFDRDWALLCAGNRERFNTMTISWGGLGTLWNKPVATVYVKPVRYTHEFMEQSEFFTIGFFGKQYRSALNVFGSRSGRDCDKVALSGLTPRAEEDFIVFEEARLTLFCKKIYSQDLVLSEIPQDAVENFYRREAPHTMYLGEVLKISEK